MPPGLPQLSQLAVIPPISVYLSRYPSQVQFSSSVFAGISVIKARLLNMCGAGIPAIVAKQSNVHGRSPFACSLPTAVGFLLLGNAGVPSVIVRAAGGSNKKTHVYPSESHEINNKRIPYLAPLG
jgi:hypothetical protein